MRGDSVAENSRFGALACGAAKSVHVTVVDITGEERIVDTAVLMEIEKLRRASFGGFAQEVSGGISGRNLSIASGS
jgi:hypothetical protein